MSGREGFEWTLENNRLQNPKNPIVLVKRSSYEADMPYLRDTIHSDPRKGQGQSMRTRRREGRAGHQRRACDCRESLRRRENRLLPWRLAKIRSKIATIMVLFYETVRTNESSQRSPFFWVRSVYVMLSVPLILLEVFDHGN